MMTKKGMKVAAAAGGDNNDHRSDDYVSKYDIIFLQDQIDYLITSYKQKNKQEDYGQKR